MDSAKSTTTIREFFAQSLAPEQLSRVSQGGNLKSVEDNIAKKIPGFKLPPSFYQQMINQLLDMLDIKIPPLMGTAWSKYQELQKYLDADAYPPDKAYFVPTATHTFKHEFKPSLKPVVNNIELEELPFVVRLELKVDGMVLKVQGGKIMEMGIGSCTGTGTITCGVVTIMKKDSDTINLPGVMSLNDGIPIYDPTRETSSEAQSQVSTGQSSARGQGTSPVRG